MSALRVLKGFLVLVAVLTTVPALFVAYVYAVYFFRDHEHTLPIEGRVTDAVTGEPVPQLLVTSEWSFHRPALVDSSGWGEGENALTDADGRFRIKARDVTRLWSGYDFQSLMFRHPLYDFKMYTVNIRNVVEQGNVRVDGNKVIADTEVMKLADRYSKPEDNADLADALAGIHPEFFSAVKEQFGATYDREAILTAVLALTSRFPEGNARNGIHRLRRERNLLLMRFGKIPEPSNGL